MFESVQDIKDAVSAGKKVYWSNKGYEVIKDSCGQFAIVFLPNNNCIGLTWRDGTTLNGELKDFFTE